MSNASKSSDPVCDDVCEGSEKVCVKPQVMEEVKVEDIEDIEAEISALLDYDTSSGEEEEEEEDKVAEEEEEEEEPKVPKVPEEEGIPPAVLKFFRELKVSFD